MMLISSPSANYALEDLSNNCVSIQRKRIPRKIYARTLSCRGSYLRGLTCPTLEQPRNSCGGHRSRDSTRIDEVWECARVQAGEANPEQQTLSLEDRLSKLVSQPVSEEAARIIKRVAELVGSHLSWPNDIKMALGQLEQHCKTTHKWLAAAEEIGKEMGKHRRSVQRLSPMGTAGPGKRPEKAKGDHESAATCSDDNGYGGSSVTDQVSGQAAERFGRQLKFVASRESNQDFTNRSVRTAQERFRRSDRDRARQAAARHIRSLMEGLDVSISDLDVSKRSRQNGVANTSQESVLPLP
jgi:hypothetical protein